MSYILDALRKSETERRQGKIPDLGQQVQLIHHPRKKRISPVVWVAVALVLNAIVLAVVFWPIMPTNQVEVEVEPAASKPHKDEPTASVVASDSLKPESAVVTEVEPKPEPIDNPAPEPEAIPQAIAEEPIWEQPTIIVPSTPLARDREPLPEDRPSGRVPHLVELPLSFQKSVPDLIFNSHIYASEPSARRVMINDNYLRRGDRFSGLKVENITEDGVVLSKDGQRFRVGTVRDWVSPQ